MDSDDVFWLLLLSRRSVDEAALAWWLMRGKAELKRRIVEPAVMARHFGFGRKSLFRAREALKADGWVRCWVGTKSFTEFEALAPTMLSALVDSSVSECHRSTVLSFCGGMKRSTAAARLAFLRQSRQQAILLVWLDAMAGPDGAPVLVSARQLEQHLGGLIDHVTAWRAMARLQAAGLVAQVARTRDGTSYQLVQSAYQAQLASPCPFGISEGRQIPGWSLHDFPMLEQLRSLAQSAQPAASEATASVSADESAVMIKEIEC